jgi:hypothetical protein
MVDFVIAGLVMGNFALGVRFSLRPCRYRSHFLCVAANVHVLSGYVECVTRRQLRIGKNWCGTLTLIVSSVIAEAAKETPSTAKVTVLAFLLSFGVSLAYLLFVVLALVRAA